MNEELDLEQVKTEMEALNAEIHEYDYQISSLNHKIDSCKSKLEDLVDKHNVALLKKYKGTIFRLIDDTTSYDTFKYVLSMSLSPNHYVCHLRGHVISTGWNPSVSSFSCEIEGGKKIYKAISEKYNAYVPSNGKSDTPYMFPVHMEEYEKRLGYVYEHYMKDAVKQTQENNEE
jgi:hypothetical protein